MNSIEITVANVHRNEQVNIVGLARGLQAVLCSNLKPGFYYALLPMMGCRCIDVLDREGEQFAEEIHRQYGSHLQRFPMNYVAQVYSSNLLSRTTAGFWQDLKCAGLFKYWEPGAWPFPAWSRSGYTYIQMLCVYEVDRNLGPYMARNQGHRNAPRWEGGPLSCVAEPVLTDKQMSEQMEKLETILVKHNLNKGEPHV